MMHTRSALTFFLLVSTLTGCYSNGLEAIDREVTQLLRDRHQDTLGQDAPMDPNLAPTLSTSSQPTDRAYDRAPGTRNPHVSSLPARRAREGENVERDLSGQPALQFRLPESLHYAVEHSRDYRSRKEDLFVAAINLLIEKHLWGPRFFNDITASFTGTPEAGDHDHAFSLINDLRVTQRLPNGGEVSVGAVVSFVEQLRTEAGSTADSGQDAALEASVVFPLLRGAGKVAQEDLIQAYRDLIYSTREFEAFRQDFLVDTSTAYFDLIQQQGQIRNLEAQLRSLEQLTSRIQALAQAGREPYFEVQRSEIQVLSARNNLSSARENYANRLDAFKIRIGMATTQALELLPVEIEVPIPFLDMNESMKTAWELRLDLQTADDQIDDARRQVAVAKNNLLPDLDVFARGSLPTDPGKRRAGLDLDAGTGSYTVGATFSAPLDRRIEALQHRTSLINLERSERNFTLLRDTIALGVRQAIRQIERAQSTLILQSRNLELAEKRREGVLLRERTLGPRDIIEAEEDLLLARDEVDGARRDLRVSVLNYLLATGQMRVSPAGQWLAPAQLTGATK